MMFYTSIYGVTPSREMSIPADFMENLQYNPSDYAGYLTSPLRWDGEQWKTAGAIVGITGALILVDKPIFFSVNPDKIKTVNHILNPFFEMGNWQVVSITLPTLYLTSLVLQDPKLHHGTLMAMKSFGAEVLVTQGLKNLMYRTLNKNEETSNPFEFKGPRWEFPSEGVLPSGHAAIVWSIMTAYADEYKDDPVLPSLFYGSAILSNISLITTRSHWISDIFLGAAIGYYTAKTARYYDEKHELNTRIQPIVSSSFLGMGVTTRF